MTEEFQALIVSKLGALCTAHACEKGEMTLFCQRETIIPALTILRDDRVLRFTQLVDLCGVDEPDDPERFVVVYHLLSMTQNKRVRIKVRTSEDVAVPSACDMFPSANWFEREAFDLFGIIFDHHPDLRRILTDYGFDGHPLRKDFPLTGFVELHYDPEQKRVVYAPVELQQDFRNFDALSPWEGMTDVQLPGDSKATHQMFGWTPTPKTVRGAKG